MAADDDPVTRLRSGDEATFVAVVDAWSRGMLRTARAYVGTAEAAEDVVQETWLAVIRGLHRFEGRSSLRTWVYRILINIAKTRGVADNRTVTWSDLVGEDAGPTVDPDRFQGPGERYPGHWRHAPEPWPSAESAAVGEEVRRTVEAAVAELPHRQRVVITLRDIDGYSSDEVCEILDLSAANQRVLLHRARAAVRALLAHYLTAEMMTP
ncbi:sigma-70 family RNA polymerase sigma factor [Virgisporangium aurantiacum]